MGCSAITLNGITIDCGLSGGVSKVYLAPIADVSGVTVASGSVTGVTMVATKKFKEYSFRKGNADFSFKNAIDKKAGTRAVQTDINLQFNKMERTKRTEIEALSTGLLYAIVLDNNGLYWFIGYGSYVDATSVDGQTGAEMKDGNFYKIVLGAETGESPMEMDSAAITSII